METKIYTFPVKEYAGQGGDDFAVEITTRDGEREACVLAVLEACQHRDPELGDREAVEQIISDELGGEDWAAADLYGVALPVDGGVYFYEFKRPAVRDAERRHSGGMVDHLKGRLLRAIGGLPAAWRKLRSARPRPDVCGTGRALEVGSPRCPRCGGEVWDAATADQRLNKCWNCGLRFDGEEEVAGGE